MHHASCTAICKQTSLHTRTPNFNHTMLYTFRNETKDLKGESLGGRDSEEPIPTPLSPPATPLSQPPDAPPPAPVLKLPEPAPLMGRSRLRPSPPRLLLRNPPSLNSTPPWLQRPSGSFPPAVPIMEPVLSLIPGGSKPSHTQPPLFLPLVNESPPTQPFVHINLYLFLTFPVREGIAGIIPGPVIASSMTHVSQVMDRLGRRSRSPSSSVSFLLILSASPLILS